MRAGLPRYTILRPTFFIEIWLGPTLGFDFSNARARLYGTGQGRLNWLSLEDVARFAVCSLESLRAWNTTFTLGGEEALGQLDVIRLCKEESGRPWQLEPVPESFLRAQLASATDPRQLSLAALLLNFALGGEVDPRPAMQAIPVRPMRVRDLMQRTLAHLPRCPEPASHL